MSRRSTLLPSLLVVFVACLWGGCQTYDQKTAETQGLWNGGNLEGAAADFTRKAEKAQRGKDALVYRLEQAMALRAAGRIAESQAAFQQADDLIQSFDDKAKTSVSREAGALLSNQANLPYTGRDYDRILVSTYKALNHLQLGEPEKARPELLRAHQRQQDALENNRKRIQREQDEIRAAAGEKAAEHQSVLKAQSDPRVSGVMTKNYGALDSLKPYADYANPFTVYLDGVYFLALSSGGSDLERARKSFERVRAMSSDNKFIAADLALAEKAAAGEPMPPRTFVLFETGSAPRRDQFRIDIPLFIVGANRVPYVGAALPTLEFQPNSLKPLTVSASAGAESTVTLASMDSVIGQAFRDELPGIVTKTLMSTTIKATAAYFVNKTAEEQGGAVAGLVSMLATAATQAAVNIADTRTWTTLPKEYQFCSLPTPADGKLRISAPNTQQAEVAVDPKSINLILVRSVSPYSPLVVTAIRLK
ncbi:MAG: COG3014 family protein [Verrucomicrobiota bacterium]